MLESYVFIFLLLFSSFLHIMLADLFAVKAIYSVIVLLVLFLLAFTNCKSLAARDKSLY